MSSEAKSVAPPEPVEAKPRRVIVEVNSTPTPAKRKRVKHA